MFVLGIASRRTVSRGVATLRVISFGSATRGMASRGIGSILGWIPTTSPFSSVGACHHGGVGPVWKRLTVWPSDVDSVLLSIIVLDSTAGFTTEGIVVGCSSTVVVKATSEVVSDAAIWIVVVSCALYIGWVVINKGFFLNIIKFSICRLNR